MPTLAVNPFDTIKETLNIADIARFYGLEVKSNNQALCPFHNERTPSFTIYPKTNSWHCFGCGAGGSAIDFVMAYCGLDSLEAAKKLDMDYQLGLFDCKPSPEELHRLKEQQEQRNADKGLNKAFEDYINKAYNLLCDYLHLLHDWKAMYAPKTIDELDTLHPLFTEACHQLDYIEYLADFLMGADIDAQINFYQSHRKELRKIATKLCTNSGKTDESVK